ncbi:MAG: hypothetical protein ABFS09_08800 [Thermodesulfobacteriota bacterium]
MLLGEALIRARVISQAHLNKALQVQTGNAHLSLGEILTKLFNIPRNVVESHYINLSIIPLIKEWLQEQLDIKEFSEGIPLRSIIDHIAITVPSFTRHQAETVSFDLGEDGMYRENNSVKKMERILATIEPLVITTKKQQKIVFNNVHLEVNLEDKGVRADNPGFFSEVKLRLLKSLKELD